MADADAPPTPNRVRPRHLPRLVARAFRFVWHAGSREFSLILALEVLTGFGVAAQLLIAKTLLGKLLDTGAEGFSLGSVAPQLVGLAITTVIAAFALTALTERRTILTELVSRHVHDLLIDVATDVDLAAFDSPEFYDRLERAKTNAPQRTYELASGVISLGSGLTGMAALVAVLFTIGLPFLPLVLFAYVPLWWATARNGRAAYEFTFWATSADREREYLQRVLTGKPEAKEVRLYGLSQVLRKRYSDVYDLRIRAFRAVIRRRLRRSLLANVVSTSVVLGAAALLIQLAADGHISTADAGVAVIAMVQLGSRLRTLNSGAASLTESSLFLSEFVDFLGLKQVAAPDATPSKGVPFDGIAATNVTFAYPGTGRDVVREVSLHIAPGEMVALVGRNGSGKSTMAKILCGLYEPTSGHVLWGETDMRTIDPARVRSSIAAVFQDFVCYQLPARDNVGMGDILRLADLPGIRRAAEQGGIDDYLAQLPAAYDTVLSRAFEGGAELSIGQWQRVALARAFFRDAPLVVLDEPAAALDAEAEHELSAHIRRLRSDRAALVISHRLSTVREADRIYVLDGGQVVESGSHDELMRLGGLYAELFSLQAAAYVSDDRTV